MTIFKNVEKERRKYHPSYILTNNLFVFGLPLEERVRLKEVLPREEYEKVRERASIVEILFEHMDWCHWESLEQVIDSYYAPDGLWRERYY